MGHVNIETYFFLSQFFYLGSFDVFNLHLHLHLGTRYKEIDNENQNSYNQQHKDHFCPPSLIPHRENMDETLCRSFRPLSIVIAGFYLKDIIARRKIGINSSARPYLCRIHPVVIKAFQFISEHITLTGKIVNHRECNSEKLKLRRERNTQQLAIVGLIEFDTFVHRLLCDRAMLLPL